MSNGWIGADVDELQALGDTCAQQAELLRGSAARLSGLVVGIAWNGGDLDLFAQDWSSRHRTNLLAAAGLLDTLRATLVSNADAQVATSAAETGSTGGAVGAAGGRAIGKTPSTQALQDEMRDLLLDPVALAAWWNSLSEQEVDRLIAADPGLVLSLGSLLDPAERQAALDAYLDQVYGDSTLSSQAWGVGASGSIPIYKVLSLELAADLGLDLVQTGDGYQVVVRGGAAVGASAGDKGGLVGIEALYGADGDMTYSFDSLEEAQAFIDELAHAALPDNPLDWALGLGGLVPMPTGNPLLGTYLAQEVGEVLVANADSLQSVSGSVSTTIAGNGAAAGFSTERGATMSYDVTDGSTTFRAEFGVEGQAGLPVPVPGLPTQGAGVMGAELTLDANGTPSTLRVTADGQVLLGGVLDPALMTALNGNGVGIGGDGGTGVGGAATLEIDLTDPRNTLAGEQLLGALQTGDLQTAQESVAVLYENSSVVVQTSTVTAAEVGVDLEVVGASGSYEQADQTGLWVKPPGETDYHDASGRP